MSYSQNTRSVGSSSSTHSDASDRSKSTIPTVYSDRPTSKRRDDYTPDLRDITPTDSVSTYASTIPSTDDLADEPPPLYEVDDRRIDVYPTDVLPSTPSTFGKLFPSSRRLLIRHDDATLDGNMNLRVDTSVAQRAGHQQDVTLFHLRMHDLFSRKFSFRRYCRDSGREVCHSERRSLPTAAEKHPVLRRSWSSVLASLRPGNGPAPGTALEHKRHDSGYRSGTDDTGVDEDGGGRVPRDGGPPSVTLGDSIRMEFSNYAHVELKRRGQRYEYEYWATKYQWRRQCRKEGDLRTVSYHLINTRTNKQVAHMMPEILTPLEAADEEKKGGWVPPSSLWINDPSVYQKMPDVADVIVATGLVVLVDDCIRQKWHAHKPASFSLARSIELMGPRRLIDEVFLRRGSA
ncbi:hypothetical protein HFD88_005795 [Aspergillus terreus]|nr:hypothetical protein HFD88_005795 [Aspergillus terreus]